MYIVIFLQCMRTYSPYKMLLLPAAISIQYCKYAQYYSMHIYVVCNVGNYIMRDHPLFSALHKCLRTYARGGGKLYCML